mgnify:CR=1 FL=1
MAIANVAKNSITNIPIPNIMKTNKSAKPSKRKAISMPSKGIQEIVSRITSPEKTAGAKLIANPKITPIVSNQR